MNIAGLAAQVLGKSRAVTIRRLAISLAVIPVVFGSFLMIMVAFEDFTPLKAEEALIASYWVSAAFAVTLWILIWRRAVLWNARARAHTSGLTLLLLVVPLLLLSFLLRPGAAMSVEVWLWSAPIIGWGVWMACTVAIWPLREADRSEQGPQCLRCGYSLRGLRSTRCPECGDEPTLDELWFGAAASG